MPNRSLAAHAVIAFLLAMVAPAAAGVQPANDECVNATVIGLPFSTVSNVTDATFNATDPSSTCEFGSTPSPQSVWYRFTAASDGLVVANTFESSFDTIVTVLTGSCGALTEAACDDDFAGGELTTRLVFPVATGQTYFLLVTHGVGSFSGLGLEVDVFPAAKVAKNAAKCQSAIKKAAASFIAKAGGSAAKCVDGLTKCVQIEGGALDCFQKACGKCQGALEKRTAQADKLVAAVVKKCGPANVPFATLLSSPGGLGYSRLATACPAITGDPLDDVNAAAECVLERQICVGERIFGVQSPRAREFLELCQIPGVMLGCLPDNGDGGVVASEDLLKPVTKCGAAIEKAATKFVSAKLKALQKCADRMFNCLMTKTPADECVNKARPKCEGDLAKIDAARLALFAAIDKKCGEIPFNVLSASSGLNISGVTDECNNVGATVGTLAAYSECVFRQHECEIDSLFRFEMPLGVTLLRFGDYDIPGFCAD